MDQDPGRLKQEDKLDEALKESFPASDPPANTVHTGIRVGPPEASRADVTDNPAASRFELRKDGQIAFLEYERRPDAFVLVHTEVPPELRGQRLGDALARAGLETARASGLRLVVVCPFVRAYMKKQV